MLSGHTHGGQIKLPGLPALVTYSHYGQKYLYGLCGPVCPVYTSAGVGMSKMPGADRRPAGDHRNSTDRGSDML